METHQSADENPCENFPRSISCKKDQGKFFSKKNHRIKATVNSVITAKQDKKLENLSGVSEKQQMLDQLNYQESEISFLQTFVSHFIDINELFKIRQNSNYDPDIETWTLPNFIVRQKRTVFPNLQRSFVKESVNAQDKTRKVGLMTEEDAGEERLANNDRPATSCAQRKSKSKNGRFNF